MVDQVVSTLKCLTGEFNFTGGGFNVRKRGSFEREGESERESRRGLGKLEYRIGRACLFV